MKNVIKRITLNILNPISSNQRILTGFLWVSLFVLFGRLAGAGKEIAVAWRYGVNEKVDAYVFVLNLLTLPVSVWSGILTVVLVPVLSNLKRSNEKELVVFYKEFFGITVVIGFILWLVALLVMPWFMSTNSIGLPVGVLEEAQPMIRRLAILIPIGMHIALFSTWLLAFGRHQNTLYEAIPATILLGVILLPNRWISEPLILGTIVGFALHLLTVAFAVKNGLVLTRPSFSLKSNAWKGFWAGIGITAAGQILMSLTAIVDQLFLAGFGPGILASFSYANRFVALITGVAGLAIGRAVLPVFSDVNAESTDQLRKISQSWSGIIFISTFIIVLIVFIYSDQIIKIFYQRGEFTIENTKNVANLLRYGLLQIPFYTCGLVFVFALSSAQFYRTIAIVSMINLIVKIIGNYYLTKIFGPTGVFISTAIMYAFAAVIFAFSVSRMLQTKPAKI